MQRNKESLTFRKGKLYVVIHLATANDVKTHIIFDMVNLEDLFTLENINDAFYKCFKASNWKESTQRYHADMLRNNISIMDDMLNGKYKVSPTNNFTINERGKKRSIEAPCLRDRIIQKILCTKILIPQLTKYLIYDNYASLKNRGTHFARKRIDAMLHRHMMIYGSEGYVLKIDVKKYFENINHAILKRLTREKIIADEKVMKLIDYLIDTSSKTDKGLNLGSEAPQILAVFYLTKVDNYIKTVKGFKNYGRYMDDMFIISPSKEELKDLLNGIKGQLKELDLEINESKTQIIKLSKGFTFMQIKYRLAGSRIVKIPTRSKVTRERRRLKKYKRLKDKNLMSDEDISNCYKSWKFGLMKDCNRCYRTMQKMDDIFNKSFNTIRLSKHKNRNSVINEAFRKEKNLHETYRNYRF